MICPNSTTKMTKMKTKKVRTPINKKDWRVLCRGKKTMRMETITIKVLKQLKKKEKRKREAPS